MAQQIQRPDTPLAATPEPQPISSGVQNAPMNKYQKTADTAIQQIKQMSPIVPVDTQATNTQEQ